MIMANQLLDGGQIRYILQNAAKIKSDGMCIECRGTGWVNWDNETGDDTKPGQSFSEDRETDECEKCKGIGYVW